jgi:hypothetical protein
MRTLSDQVSTLPVGMEGGAQVWQNVGSFIDGLCQDLGLEKDKWQERHDSTRGDHAYEEATFSFDLKRVSRQNLARFLYRVETERPVLRTYTISNFQPSDRKHEDFSAWDVQLVIAYRRALR